MSSLVPSHSRRVFGENERYASSCMERKRPAQLWRFYRTMDRKAQAARNKGEGLNAPALFYLEIFQERLNLIRDYYQLMTWVDRIVKPHRVTRSDGEILARIKNLPAINALFYNRHPPSCQAEEADDLEILNEVSGQFPNLLQKGLKVGLQALKSEWEDWQNKEGFEELAGHMGRELKALSRDCPAVAEGILRRARAVPEDPPTPELDRR